MSKESISIKQFPFERVTQSPCAILFMGGLESKSLVESALKHLSTRISVFHESTDDKLEDKLDDTVSPEVDFEKDPGPKLLVLNNVARSTLCSRFAKVLIDGRHFATSTWYTRGGLPEKKYRSQFSHVVIPLFRLKPHDKLNKCAMRAMRAMKLDPKLSNNLYPLYSLWSNFGMQFEFSEFIAAVDVLGSSTPRCVHLVIDMRARNPKDVLFKWMDPLHVTS